MADEALRQSRRHEQEDAQTQARHLRHALRTGQLSPQRLRQAALLGDPAARLACDDPPPPPSADDLAGWVTRLGGNGQELLLRVGVAAARLALLVWEVEQPADERYHYLLRRVERWILKPGEADDLLLDLFRASDPAQTFPHLDGPWSQVSAKLQQLTNLLFTELTTQLLFLDPAEALRSGRALTEIPWQGRLADVARAAEAVLVGCAYAYDPEHLPQGIARGLEAAARATRPMAVLAAVQREVVPWVLGRGDAVRLRAADPSETGG